MTQEIESPAETVDRGIRLLNELLSLKTAQDGVQRAPVGLMGNMDAFSRQVHELAHFLQTAAMAMPAFQELVDMGRALEAKGDAKLDYSESYADAALHFLRQKVQPITEVSC